MAGGLVCILPQQSDRLWCDVGKVRCPLVWTFSRVPFGASGACTIHPRSNKANDNDNPQRAPREQASLSRNRNVVAALFGVLYPTRNSAAGAE
jgi:hypothetical protein